jgi:hypothetical protein
MVSVSAMIAGQMTPITTTFTSDPKMIMKSYRACHRRAYVGRWITTAALVVVGLLTRSITLVVAGPFLWVVMDLFVRRQLRAYRGGPRTVTVNVTEDEYRTEGQDTATSHAWSTFQRVSRVGQFWVLRISSAAAMALPVTALNADQAATFEDLLRRKDLLSE